VGIWLVSTSDECVSGVILNVVAYVAQLRVPRLLPLASCCTNFNLSVWAREKSCAIMLTYNSTIFKSLCHVNSVRVINDKLSK